MTPIFLHPTGVSIVVGQIDMAASKIDQYVEALDGAMTTWENASDLSWDDQYKACGYLSIGNWSFTHLTLVKELGFTNHLAYIGRTRSQSFFHAHDYELFLDINKIKEGEAKKLLKCLKLLGLPTFYECKNEPNKWMDIAGSRNPKMPTGLNNTCFTNGNYLRLGHIYSGDDSVYPVTGKNPQPESVATIGNNKTNPQDLMAIYQLKLNPAMNKLGYAQFKTLVYLAVVYEFHQQLEAIKSNVEKDYLPCFIRPMIASGYFEMTIFLRGRDPAVMEHLMQPIKLLTLNNARDLLGGLKDYFPQFFKGSLESTLFQLSHTTFGLPYSKSKAALEKCCGSDPKSDYDALKDYFKYYNSPPGNNLYVFNARTLISGKFCRISEVKNAFEKIEKVVKKCHDLSSNMVCGSNDFDVFSKNISIAEYLTILHLLRSMLVYKNPIVHTIKTKLAFPFRSGQKKSTGEKYNTISLMDVNFISNIIARCEEKNGSEKWTTDLKNNWNDKVVDSDQREERFRAFLNRHFSKNISQETLDMFFSTLCAIDSFLAEPCLAHHYVDVASYLRHHLEILFTLEPQNPNGMDGTLKYTALKNGKTYELEPKRSVTNTVVFSGLEAYMLNLVSAVQDVISQRQPGNFPHHDKGLSRLSDIRAQHCLKVLGISWLIDDLIFSVGDELKDYFARVLQPYEDNAISTYPNELSPSGSEKTPPLNEEPEANNQTPYKSYTQLVSRLEINHSPHLAKFCNAPEVMINREETVISMSSRFLTSIEGLVLVAHEVAHYFAPFFMGGKLNDCFLNVKNEGYTISDNDPETLNDLTEKMNIKKERDPKKSGGDKGWPGLENNCEKKGSSTTLEHSCEVDTRYIWEEVCADLFVFRICFSQITLHTDDSLKDLFPSYCSRSKRDKNEGAEYWAYDLSDDFLLSMVTLWLQLGRIKTTEAVHSIVIRMILLLGVLKRHHQDYEELNSDDEYYETYLRPFFENKLPAHLARLWANGQHFISHSFWASFLGEKVPELLTMKDHTTAKAWAELVAERDTGPWTTEKLHAMAKTKYLHYAGTIRSIEKEHAPLAAFVRFLIYKNQETIPENGSPYLRWMEENEKFKNSQNFHKLIQGLLPVEWWQELNTSSDFFATSFQLAGFLNLGFSQRFKESELHFLKGLPIFKEEGVQSNLARVRRLIHTCIANGAWMEIRSTLEKWSPQTNIHDSNKKSHEKSLEA